MRILLVSPLYPPDIAPAAEYLKELARRLRVHHAVTVITYGTYPEYLEGVVVQPIDKRTPLAVRLGVLTIRLITALPRADVVYALNGASAELPLLIASWVSRTPVLYARADTDAHVHASGLRRILEQQVERRARALITSFPDPKPEVLPFAPYPTDAFEKYERSWQEHLSLLSSHFDHVR